LPPVEPIVYTSRLRHVVSATPELNFFNSVAPKETLTGGQGL
jgi:hypothetical protein